ncbi:hypothetical protein LRD69_08795 [Streptomyces sp. JH14]|uniref:hypothetical protein n=1 Tax=Streptomyces sp. JH14 TaxID=2793630 RepID=UPI0023F6CE63|nr:hypothetical protein [Streptomyces sp. JH14]MDF6042260.1 hypothetical protein [Streptomyces sp. JH14]
MVIWSDLMYPGLDGRVIEEVRFHLEQYLGEIERAYAALNSTGAENGAVRDLDGIDDAGVPGVRQQKAAAGGLGPWASTLVPLGLALSLAALSLLVMVPAARHLRSFQDGERASATLHTSGSCMLGQCKVEIEAAGRTVVADLPAGSGGGKNSVGTRMTVRYHADKPQVAVREDDVGGGGAALLAVMSGGAALLFLVLSVVAQVVVVRQRRARPMAGRTPQDA